MTGWADPPAGPAFADYFDGQTARRQRVQLRFANAPDQVLVITPAEGEAIHWPCHQIRSLPDQADRAGLVLRWTADPLARLMLEDPDTVALARSLCPQLDARAPVAGKGRLLAWALAAVASVALIVTVLVPVMADQLAEYLPPAGEKALGDTTLEQIRGSLGGQYGDTVRFCESPAGIRALDKMVDRVVGDTLLPYPVTMHVLNHPMVNAFALPGGHIVAFRGLLQAAEAPEEIAAVLAHELGHVVHRDPTRGALRTAGSIGVVGLLFGDFAGGSVVLFLANRLIDARYSQAAEAAADTFAHARMTEAELSPGAMAIFLERLMARHGDRTGLAGHLAAHPSLVARITAARAAEAAHPVQGEPVLSASEWAELRDICTRTGTKPRTAR